MKYLFFPEEKLTQIYISKIQVIKYELNFNFNFKKFKQ
jgi:hypothetical protein